MTYQVINHCVDRKSSLRMRGKTDFLSQKLNLSQFLAKLFINPIMTLRMGQISDLDVVLPAIVC